MSTTLLKGEYEKYQQQVDSYSQEEIEKFNETLWGFLNNKDYPKDIREAVAYFYMPLHLYENKTTSIQE